MVCVFVKRALGIVVGDAGYLAVKDEGAVLDGVAVEDKLAGPGSAPDRYLAPGVIQQDLEGPGLVDDDVAEAGSPPGLAVGQAVFDFDAGTAVKPGHVEMKLGFFYVCEGLSEPALVLPRRVEVKAVLAVEGGDEFRGYVGDAGPLAEVEPVGKGYGVEQPGVVLCLGGLVDGPLGLSSVRNLLVSQVHLRSFEITGSDFVERLALEDNVDTGGGEAVIGKDASIDGCSGEVFHDVVASMSVRAVALHE